MISIRQRTEKQNLHLFLHHWDRKAWDFVWLVFSPQGYSQFPTATLPSFLFLFILFFTWFWVCVIYTLVKKKKIDHVRIKIEVQFSDGSFDENSNTYFWNPLEMWFGHMLPTCRSSFYSKLNSTESSLALGLTIYWGLLDVK